MEEKLYFRPVSYSKGSKKYKEKPASVEKHTDGHKDHRVRNIIIFLLAVAVIVFVILWLLKGKNTTSGQYPANVRSESLICSSDKNTYEKVDHVNSDDKNFEISLIFNGKESLSSGSLKYTLRFSSPNEVNRAVAVSQAQFNLGVQALGYDSGKFNNKFSVIDNDLVITLHINSSKDVDEVTKSYFLLKEDSQGNLPITLAEYRQNYESQGFSCTSTLDK